MVLRMKLNHTKVLGMNWNHVDGMTVVWAHITQLLSSPSCVLCIYTSVSKVLRCQDPKMSLGIFPQNAKWLLQSHKFAH